MAWHDLCIWYALLLLGWEMPYQMRGTVGEQVPVWVSEVGLEECALE